MLIPESDEWELPSNSDDWELPPESDEWDLDPNFASNLDGTWKSDWELTKAHLKADCRLNDDEILGYEWLMGKMTARYCGSRVILDMPEVQVTKDGKVRVIEGWTSDTALDVVARTNWQIALFMKASSPINKDSISIITFVDFDIYWVYLGNSSVCDLHIREYFRKVPVN